MIWTISNFDLGCSGYDREVLTWETQAMLNWIDNVIKLDDDMDSVMDQSETNPEPDDEPETPEYEADTVSTNEILETVQSVLGFLGSVFDFLTETKKND